jgi:hypothetical protein
LLRIGGGFLLVVRVVGEPLMAGLLCRDIGGEFDAMDFVYRELKSRRFWSIFRMVVGVFILFCGMGLLLSLYVYNK